MPNRGFTLIEVVITSAVVACGLAAVASMFSLAVRADIANRQAAVAAALLYDKMEQFRSTPLNDPLWADGADDITYDTKYMRVWQVRGGPLRTVTITIYAENASNRKQSELIRATTLVSGTF